MHLLDVPGSKPSARVSTRRTRPWNLRSRPATTASSSSGLIEHVE